MRFLKIVVLTLILAHTDRVLGQKRGKGKATEGPCGKRYMHKINNKCYYFSTKKMNWFGAQNNCLRKGLNLANLATTEDYNSVLNLLRRIGDMEDFWFGGNDLQAEGQFRYISNGRPVLMTNFNANLEPTYRSNLDDCLEIRLRENVTQVTDENCGEEQFFVCEQNAVECSTPTSTSGGETQHSHEHLHHFHHNAAKEEEAGTNKEGVEGDSRAADNTNSTEVGTSQEDQNETTTDNNKAETPKTDDEKTETDAKLTDGDGTTGDTQQTEETTTEESSTPASSAGADAASSPPGTETKAAHEGESTAEAGDTTAPVNKPTETPAGTPTETPPPTA